MSLIFCNWTSGSLYQKKITVGMSKEALILQIKCIHTYIHTYVIYMVQIILDCASVQYVSISIRKKKTTTYNKMRL